MMTCLLLFARVALHIHVRWVSQRVVSGMIASERDVIVLSQVIQELMVHVERRPVMGMSGEEKQTGRSISKN